MRFVDNEKQLDIVAFFGLTERAEVHPALRQVFDMVLSRFVETEKEFLALSRHSADLHRTYGAEPFAIEGNIGTKLFVVEKFPIELQN
jgi:hypothetical protein